ncbi:hypothetical protein KFE25_007502 [Diacronema lutheri]|uniref:FHA domain-containing protein n=1 Tax=Diacronema lutheri TaxID=2081491 RepID=A0A8J6CDU8_DIALT|nr:hypothetical protein KFE25_007502 [Diacronema lutheri]
MAALQVDGSIVLKFDPPNKRFEIGRSEQADLPIAESSVSRRHCTVFHDGAWRIVDNDSAQGTVVSGARLRPGAPVELADGARVQFGQSSTLYTFVLHAGRSSPRRDSANGPASQSAPVGLVAPIAAPAAPAAPIGPEPVTVHADEAQPPPDLTGLSERTTGTAVRWDVSKGWGFVKPDAGGPDVFAHKNDLHAESGAGRSLREGEHVEFRLAYTDGRPKAVDITGPGGAFVTGQPAPAVVATAGGADGAGRADAVGGMGGRGGRGRGGRGRGGLSFYAIELPGQTAAAGPDRGVPTKPRAAPPFVPRQARKAGAASRLGDCRQP